MWRSLFLVMLFLLVPAMAEAQQRRAFIVGVQDYAELEKLTRTVEDANGYASVFGKHLGYTVTPLSGAPKRSDFNRAFGVFLESIRPGDEVVFVFSGHGWSDGAENYLALADAKKNASEFELKEETVALSRSVLQQIKARNPSVVVAIIDACRDNPFASLTKNGFEKGLVRTETQEGMLVVYAAGERQKALDRLGATDKAAYSVFTRVLLPKLRDGSQPLLKVLDDTREEVERLASTISHRQRPAFYSDISLKFCLAGQCGSRWISSDIELQAWRQIDPEHRTADELCLNYAEHESSYPKGKFAALAADLGNVLCGSITLNTRERNIPSASALGLEYWSDSPSTLLERVRNHFGGSCTAGDATACTRLAIIHEYGLYGAPKGDQISWYLHACMSGESFACAWFDQIPD